MDSERAKAVNFFNKKERIAMPQITRRTALAGLLAAPALTSARLLATGNRIASLSQSVFHLFVVGPVFLVARPHSLDVLIPEMGHAHEYLAGGLDELVLNHTLAPFAADTYTLTGLEERIGDRAPMPFPKQPFGPASFHLDFDALGITPQLDYARAVFRLPLPLSYQGVSPLGCTKNSSSIPWFAAKAASKVLPGPFEVNGGIWLRYTTTDPTNVQTQGSHDGNSIKWNKASALVIIARRPSESDNSATGGNYQAYLDYVRRTKHHLSELGDAMSNMLSGLTVQYSFIDKEFVVPSVLFDQSVNAALLQKTDSAAASIMNDLARAVDKNKVSIFNAPAAGCGGSGSGDCNCG
jgi:hypothetical protein